MSTSDIVKLSVEFALGAVLAFGLKRHLSKSTKLLITLSLLVVGLTVYGFTSRPVLEGHIQTSSHIFMLTLGWSGSLLAITLLEGPTDN